MTAQERRDRLAGWIARRASTTVAEAAAHFEISERTLHRDLAALRRQGIDVQGDPGRGGGLRLDPSRLPRTVTFQVEEVVGLYLSVAAMRQAGGLPYSRGAAAALDKLVATLPAARVRELRAFLQRIVVGRPASATVIASLAPVRADLLARLEEAFTTRRAVAFAYLDRAGARTERRAELHGLLAQAPAWYALAHDLGRGEPRMFRLDRMAGLRILRDVAFTPRPAPLIARLIDPQAYPAERAPL